MDTPFLTGYGEISWWRHQRSPGSAGWDNKGCRSVQGSVADAAVDVAQTGREMDRRVTGAC